MSEDFASILDGERARLESMRAELLQDRRLVDERIANVDDEMRAINAYEAAKTGKTPVLANAAAPRARRGSRREDILRAISALPSGMRRGEILDALCVKGDKSAEMSASNALVALSKAGQVVREDGRYRLPDIASAEDVHGALREAAE